MGVSLGVIVSLNGLFYFIKDMDPLVGWGIMGGLYILFAFILLAIIREPVDIEKKTDGICTQIKDLSIGICKAVGKNPNLLIGWIIAMLAGMPMMILEVYLMSWLNSLNKDNLFPTKDDMYQFYQF